MSTGFCLHCGLKLHETNSGSLHLKCAEAWGAEQARIASAPKTRMEQQLDRIEGLLMAIRDRYSL